MDERYRQMTDFLVGLGTDKVSHSGKTFLAHLIGVYHDLYTCSGGEGQWRFARRRFDILYRGQPDLSGQTFPFPDAPQP